MSFPAAGASYTKEELSRGSMKPLAKWRTVGCGHCYVPVDSPKVPKSTSRGFRHFERSRFEVDKKKGLFESKQQKRLVRFPYE